MKTTYPPGWDHKANENWRDFMESLDPAKHPEEVTASKEYLEDLQLEGSTPDEAEDEKLEASHLFIKIAREEVQRYRTIRNLVEAEAKNGLDNKERALLMRLIQHRINYTLDLIDLERA